MNNHAAFALAAGLVLGAAVGFVAGTSLDARDDGLPAPPHVARHAPERDAGGEDAALTAPEARSAGSTEIDSDRHRREVADAAARSAVARASVDQGQRASGPGVIRGTVSNEFGEPITGATVIRTSRDDADRTAKGGWSEGPGQGWSGYEPLGESLRRRAEVELARRARSITATSNDEGHFELEGLELGIHPIQCFAEGFTFKPTRAQTGAHLKLIGKPVGLFHIAPALPGGGAPATATVATFDVYDQQVLHRWTQEEPVLRLADRVAKIQVLHGGLERVHTGTYVADFKSDPRVVNLETDGAGPHEFELRPFDHLRIAVIDESKVAPPIEPWVKVVPAGEDDAGKLRRDGNGLFIAHELSAGAHEVHVGRGAGGAEVVESVMIAPGANEIEITLGEIDLSRFIIATCVDAKGRALDDVSFRYKTKTAGGGGGGAFQPLERPGGEYWMSLDDLTHGNHEDVESISLRAWSPMRGSLERDVDLDTNRVRFEFREPCHLTVHVTGVEQTQVDVTVEFIVDGANDTPFRIHWMSVSPDGLTESQLLQPGAAKVIVNLAGDLGWDRDPIAEKAVVLGEGEQTVTIAAPPVHDLIVHAPELEPGDDVALFLPVPGSYYDRIGSEDLDETGRAVFPALLADRYMIQCIRNGALEQMYVDVPAGEVTFDPLEVNGFRIHTMKEGGLASQAGLRIGDIVTSAGGRAVDGQAWFYRMLLELSDGPMNVDYIRDGRKSKAQLPKIEGDTDVWATFGAYAYPTELD